MESRVRQVLAELCAALLASAACPAADGKPFHVLVRDFRTVKDGVCVNYNIGTAAHCPSTVAQVMKYLPGTKVTVWANGPLSDELSSMMRRRFPEVEIVSGKYDDSASPELKAAVESADALLVASSSSIVDSVLESARAFRKTTGKRMGLAAMGAHHPSFREFDFGFFRDEKALASAEKRGETAPLRGFAPDSVFDFDCTDEAGAERFLKENGLVRGGFVCAIPGNRVTPRWEYWKEYRPNGKGIALNAETEEKDNAVLRAAIVEVVRRHGLKVLVCAEQIPEVELGRRLILDRLPADVRAQCVWTGRYWSPDLALSVYRASRLVVGVEMHSQVMAIGNGVPGIILHHPNFGTKADMFRTIGVPEWAVDLTKGGAAEEAVRIVSGILSNETGTRVKLRDVRAFLDRKGEMMYASAFAPAVPSPAGPTVELDTSADRVESPLAVPLKRIGTLRPRSTTEIRSSKLMLGCECSDRDLVDFEDYKRFLAPLGVKTIRLQGGWAKSEKEKGVYDFTWLDRQIDFARANGMEVYLDTEYGNPLYSGSNGVDLGSGFPTGEVAVAAWDRWVDALSKRYRGRVTWSMWNEPWVAPEEIAAQNIRTACVIRRNDPEAKIGALSLGDFDADRMEACVKALGKDADLFTWAVYHGYRYAPEQTFPVILKVQEMLRRVAPHLKLRQGENGCPSEYLPRGWVLNGVPWSEYSQAKWILRRMLGDLAHDVFTDVFQIVDFYNPRRKAVDGVFNTKGLLRTGLDKKVIGIKRAYYAVQNLASVFDDRWTAVRNSAFTTTDSGVAAFEFRKDTGEPLYAFWRFTDTSPRYHEDNDVTAEELVPKPVRPGDSFATAPQVFLVKNAPSLKDPVWVDLFTGRVYELCPRHIGVSSDAVRYMDIPVYDSPCFLTERSALLIESTK